MDHSNLSFIRPDRQLHIYGTIAVSLSVAAAALIARKQAVSIIAITLLSHHAGDFIDVGRHYAQNGEYYNTVPLEDRIARVSNLYLRGAFSAIHPGCINSGLLAGSIFATIALIPYSKFKRKVTPNQFAPLRCGAILIESLTGEVAAQTTSTQGLKLKEIQTKRFDARGKWCGLVIPLFSLLAISIGMIAYRVGLIFKPPQVQG